MALWNSLPRSVCRRPVRRRPARRLALEALDGRDLPSGTVALAPSVDAPAVGDRVTWTAAATDVGAAPVYQFSVADHGGAFHVVRDFSPASSFAWTPMQEGSYDIRVIAKDGYAATETASAVAADEIAPRVTGAQAVVTPTANPLVALYSVPPSSAAGTVFVQFAVAGDNPAWRDTCLMPVEPGKSTNAFIAGMLPNTTYQMRHVFSDGTGSAPVLFTTGAIPATVTLPPITVPQPPGPGTNLDQDLVFQQFANPPVGFPNPYATDLAGRVVWYYDLAQSGLRPTAAMGGSLVPGGSVLLMGVGPDAPLPNSRNVLREIDLAGNTLRETNVAAVNARLRALGHEVIHSFTHDTRILPNGQTAVIGLTERTIDVNGAPTNYVGNMILVLDRDFRVTWAWDGFDHLDVTRGPVLGEVLQPGSPEPTSAVPALPAVDWLHTNAVSWSPADQNLVLSVRHQDWVIKIDYRNGAGDGHVVWRLGPGGDFAVQSADPNPWFSHQHTPHYVDDHTLTVFDNGNTRRAADPTANSRGQVWTLDEEAMTATLVLNADMGSYSDRVGSAQRLSNGNYAFTSGAQGRPPFIGQSIEVFPDGTRSYVLQVGRGLYRAYRARTLYDGIDDELAGPPRTVQSVVLNDGSAQRSMIDQVTVTFSGPAVLEPGAIELRRQDGSRVGGQVNISLVDGKTVAVLTFVGPQFAGGSLADGTYTLTVRADRVHDRWGRALDGDADGAAGGDRVTGFHRLFGDSDGDGDTDPTDFDRFLASFHGGAAGYLWYFDHDADGDVDGADMAQFNQRRR